MLGQFAAFHTPEDVAIAVCAAPENLAHWEWVKWLPHAYAPDETDAVGQARLISSDLLQLETMFGDTLRSRQRFGTESTGVTPHVVVVLDGGHVAAGGPAGELARAGRDRARPRRVARHRRASTACSTCCSTSRRPTASATWSGCSATPSGAELRRRLGTADRLSPVEAESLARRMTPLRVSAAVAQTEDALANSLTLPDLLRLGNPYEVDTDVTWRNRPQRERLRVPIGLGASGQPVDLDIKESAQGGMGPHGLVIGATGSGKSELLRTLVLGLALTHSSETLNFVLVDFKGGATFASLDDLPHTSAVITNLEDELILVDRMKDAINGEMVRRQEALRAAGNYSSLKDYERAREQGAPLEPMPSLFIVVDEFSELLSAKPDFIDLFVMIGRLGRSLGVHLLLASQRLEEGKLRGLDTHLSYRVGLRTFSAMESRVVLGVPDAYELPGAPGNGYLKEGTDGLVRFKAAYVSGTYTDRPRRVEGGGDGGRAQILPYPAAYVQPREDDGRRDRRGARARPGRVGRPGRHADGHPRRAPARARARRRARSGCRRSDVPPTIDELMPPLVETEHGLRPSSWENAPLLATPVGLIDRPFDQRRDPYWLPLASSHFVVVGRPQSGKSHDAALADRVLRGDALAADRAVLLPGLRRRHADRPGRPAARRLGRDPARAGQAAPHHRRDQRPAGAPRGAVHRQRRIDSMATYRRMVAAGQLPGDGYGDVFLVVDGWGTVRSDYEELETAITQIAGRGLGFGVHVVLSIQRWMELRPAMRDLISTRLELRLGDASESDFDRRSRRPTCRRAAPGRGLVPEKLHFLSALPRIDHGPTSRISATGSPSWSTG